MDVVKLDKLFSRYIDKFEILNEPKKHMEYYKWVIAGSFRKMMDEALAGPIEEFRDKLYEIQDYSSNLINNKYTRPFLGLADFAKHEPETVKKMFTSLFEVADKSVEEKKHRILDFLHQSHMLRDQYYPSSHWYVDTMNSVTAYLFLYDPDHNYIYKSTNARQLADYAEFYDDWDYGENLKLDVYYRMCDQLVEQIKENNELLSVDDTRFVEGWREITGPMHPDKEKHILAYDIIYCCSPNTYNLLDGFPIVSPPRKKREQIRKFKEIALELYKVLEEAEAREIETQKAIEYVDNVYTVGKHVYHKGKDEGIIQSKKKDFICVSFSNIGEKSLGLPVAAINGIISVKEEGYEEKINQLHELIKQEKLTSAQAFVARRDFAKYAEYLDLD